MKVKVNSCICIWFANVFMGIKMPNFVPLSAGCPNGNIHCKFEHHSVMPIFTAGCPYSP